MKMITDEAAERAEANYQELLLMIQAMSEAHTCLGFALRDLGCPTVLENPIRNIERASAALEKHLPSFQDEGEET